MWKQAAQPGLTKTNSKVINTMVNTRMIHGVTALPLNSKSSIIHENGRESRSAAYKGLFKANTIIFNHPF